MQTLTTPAPLQALRQQLEQYRAAGKRAVFPIELKQQAVSLSDEYSSGAIVSALAISPTSLSRWKQQINESDGDVSHRTTPDNAATFVALPTIESCKPDSYPLSMVLNCAGSDQKITFNGEVTLDQWRDIVGKISQVLMS